jgi:predicted AAA+ superfamily ATPase
MSDTEDYLPRHLIPELEDAIASARVVNLIGPRQVGKTTLVRDLFGNGRFITLDDAAVLAAIEADPEGQLTSLIEIHSL